MSKENHKIDADDRKVFDVLSERKYTVDYFQREYSWEQKHIVQLVDDLTSTFLDAFTEGDPRTAVEHYRAPLETSFPRGSTFERVNDAPCKGA